MALASLQHGPSIPLTFLLSDILILKNLEILKFTKNLDEMIENKIFKNFKDFFD
jgi:hypothetical protein